MTEEQGPTEEQIARLLAAIREEAMMDYAMRADGLAAELEGLAARLRQLARDLRQAGAE